MFKDTLLVFFNFSFGFISFSNLLLAFSWKQFRSVTLQKMEFSMKDFFFFFYQGFLSKTLTIHRTAREGRGPSFIPLYHFQPLTNIQRFFATLHMRWLLRAFNRNACVYQAATRWDLPPYRITIWLVDWWCNVCLFTWWFDSRLLLQRFDIGNRWIWTCIGSPPYITRERLTKCGSHP